MKRRTIILLLVFAVCALFVLSGCDKNNDEQNTAEATEAATEMATEAATQEAETETETEILEPVEFELMIASKMSDLRAAEGKDTSKGDLILDYIKEKTGVSLVLNIPAFGGYNDTVTLMFASGEDMPDAVQTLNISGGLNTGVLKQAMDNGLILPVTEYCAKAENIQKYTSEKAFTSFTRNGELWVVPILRSNSRTAGIIMRWDWMQDLGYTDIALDQEYLSLEDWSSICYDMTYKDPDGNGEDDTWGFTQVGSWNKIPTHLLQAFGSNQGWQLDGSGNLVDTNLTTNWEATKEAIKYYKGMIDEGVIHPEALLMTSEEVRDKLYKGQVGGITAFGSGYSLSGFMQNIQKNDEDGTLKWFNGLVGPAGETKYVSGGTDTNGYVVTMDCDSPERLVSFFDWCLGDGFTKVTFGTEEGEDYTLDENGEGYFTREQYDNYLNNYGYYFSFTLWRRGINLNVLRTTQYDLSIKGVNASDEFNDAFVDWADVWEFDVDFDENYGYSPEISQSQQDANDALAQTIVKYLTGAASEENLDEAKQDLMDAGYSDYMAAMDAWYKENIEK